MGGMVVRGVRVQVKLRVLHMCGRRERGGLRGVVGCVVRGVVGRGMRSDVWRVVSRVIATAGRHWLGTMKATRRLSLAV